MSLEKKLKAIIEKRGPLTLAQYMEYALFDKEYGYYSSKDPLGINGDFITAPEISQMFGELTGAWLVTSWQVMGSPKKTKLVELGPGRGTLMKDILRATNKVPGFHSSIEVHLVEINETLRDIQEKTLAVENSKKKKITNEGVMVKWHDSFSSVPEGPLLLVANEFFDALPIHQFIYKDGGWQERMVCFDDKEGLAFGASAGQTPTTALIPKKYKKMAEGSVFEFSPAANKIIEEIAIRVKKHSGYALIIDYGYFDNQLKDTFQAVKKHKYHQPLEEPGMADLTAYVNFPALEEAAKKKGVHVFGELTQGEFLVSMGIQVRASMLARDATEEQKKQIIEDIKRLITPEEMGIIFKCIVITDIASPAPFCFA